MLDFEEYKDIVIVDKNGKILYCNIENLGFFNLKPEALIGTKVTMLYENLTDETSTLMRAVRYNEAIINYVQELETSDGRRPQQISNTYPISDGNHVVGAIEFANYEYEGYASQKTKKNPGVQNNKSNGTRYTLDDIITNHVLMKQIKNKVLKISGMDSPVLICGKTGTGKEMVAQSIHNTSNRREAAFVSLNCGALPESLLEGLLFGTTKGSFTDAEDKMGIFEASQGGTLFLDEINSLPLTLQAKILKAIEDKFIRRVGGYEEISLNVRIIAACNVNSEDLLKNNHLRPDLYFRLSVILLDLPVLKERSGDTLLLGNHFIEENNKTYHRNVKQLSKELEEILFNYDWPGNVRELKNTIEGAFHKTNNDEILPEHFPLRFLHRKNTGELGLGESNLKELLEKKEKRILENCMLKNNYDGKTVSHELKISRQLLKYKLDKFHITYNDAK